MMSDVFWPHIKETYFTKGQVRLRQNAAQVLMFPQMSAPKHNLIYQAFLQISLPSAARIYIIDSINHNRAHGTVE